MLFQRFKNLKKPDPEAEQKLRNEIEAEGGLEKNDMKAMILSAMLVFMPIALIILLLIALIAFIFI